MSEWREVSLNDLAARTPNSLATGPFGSAISAKHFVEDGVPVLRGSNLSLDVGVRLKDEGLAFIAESKAPEFSRSVARRGDLVFTCWGTIGQIGLVDERSRYERYIVSNKQMKLTPDADQVDSLYLYYVLSSPRLVEEVQGQTLGSAVPGFNLGQLKAIRVRVPSLRTQQRIASVLSAVDDLIENSGRQIELLERMAQAIYQEWFVRFRYPGHQEVSPVDSSIGRIPCDWRLMRASDALVINPRVKLDRNVDHPFITMGDLHEQSMVCLPSERRQGSSGSKFQRGDTLFARITPCLQNGKIGMVQTLEGAEYGRGSTEFIVLRGREVGSAFTYFLARSEDFRGNAVSSMSGASGRQRVRNECFDSFWLAVPPKHLADRYEQAVAPVLESVATLAKNCFALGRLRDLLLPKLVTGEIDVSDIDLNAAVEAMG
jgi:type I restriction enzyme S subunit